VTAALNAIYTNAAVRKILGIEVPWMPHVYYTLAFNNIFVNIIAFSTINKGPTVKFNGDLTVDNFSELSSYAHSNHL